MYTLNESNRIGYYEIEFELDGIELEAGHTVQCMCLKILYTTR